jgi:hypothetical protein
MYRTRTGPRYLKLAVLGSSLLLFGAGCAGPEGQIRSALLEAGLSKPMANCMAGRMVDRLSFGQLWKLRELKALRDKDAKSMTIQDFVKNSKSLQDPEIVSVVSSSALVCAFSG